MPEFDQYRQPDLSGYRIGWMGDYNGYLPTEPGVLDVCEDALRSITSAGALVTPCHPDYEMERLWQTWLTFRHWTLSDAKALYDDPALRAQLKPEFVWEIEGSFDMSAQRVSKSGRDRADWYRALLTLFDSYDILALPTAQGLSIFKRHSLAEGNRRQGNGHLPSLDGGGHQRNAFRIARDQSPCRF